MEGSPHFNAPDIKTDASAFDPESIKLPDHLKEYARLAKETRFKMTPVMQACLALMDKMELKCAALPDPHN